MYIILSFDHKDVETSSAYGYSCEYAQMTITCMYVNLVLYKQTQAISYTNKHDTTTFRSKFNDTKENYLVYWLHSAEFLLS